jgi:hypothetical protein
MVPQTFPSNNGKMVVFKITTLTGLRRWSDYIPVKTAGSPGILNSYDGNIDADILGSTTGKKAWIDYIPVYEDASATKAWLVSADGYIPIYG